MSQTELLLWVSMFQPVRYGRGWGGGGGGGGEGVFFVSLSFVFCLIRTHAWTPMLFSPPPPPKKKKKEEEEKERLGEVGGGESCVSCLAPLTRPDR